jgi:hypothetical protein
MVWWVATHLNALDLPMRTQIGEELGPWGFDFCAAGTKIHNRIEALFYG